MKRIVILGGGTGGTLVANRLRRAYRPGAVEVVVVDRDDDHVYQPGLLFVPFGRADARRITRPRWRQLRSGIIYCRADIDHVDVEHDRVHFGAHRALDYDLLIVATGARLLPEETEGLTGPGWQHLATIVGSLPGMPGLMTSYLGHKMAKLDIPPIPEFMELVSDSGAGIYGCQASCDLFGITKDDLIDQVQGIITVGEFYAMAAGGQIIFT